MIQQKVEELKNMVVELKRSVKELDVKIDHKQAKKEIVEKEETGSKTKSKSLWPLRLQALGFFLLFGSWIFQNVVKADYESAIKDSDWRRGLGSASNSDYFLAQTDYWNHLMTFLENRSANNMMKVVHAGGEAGRRLASAARNVANFQKLDKDYLPENTLNFILYNINKEQADFITMVRHSNIRGVTTWLNNSYVYRIFNNAHFDVNVYRKELDENNSLANRIFLGLYCLGSILLVPLYAIKMKEAMSNRSK